MRGKSVVVVIRVGICGESWVVRNGGGGQQ